jgi:hypothetical protein
MARRRTNRRKNRRRTRRRSRRRQRGGGLFFEGEWTRPWNWRLKKDSPKVASNNNNVQQNKSRGRVNRSGNSGNDPQTVFTSDGRATPQESGRQLNNTQSGGGKHRHSKKCRHRRKHRHTKKCRHRRRRRRRRRR